MVKINPVLKILTRVFPEGGRGDFLRLDMNENPEGLPADFVAEVCAKITPAFLATYPEPDGLLAALAAHHHLPEDRFSLTDGSEMAIKHVFEVFALPGTQVVTVAPSFAMYEVYCVMFGVTHRGVPIGEDLAFPTEDFLAAIGQDTSIVVLLSPNNPAGGVLPRSVVERIIKKAAEHDAVVVIDEAYHYFCEVSYLELVERYDNVVVLRTFSKLFSLAGLRLGYAVSRPEIVDYLNRVRPTFETNSVALLFGEALLRRPDIIESLIQTEKEGRLYLMGALARAGYEPRHDHGGNFVLVKPRKQPKEIEAALKERKILVKTYGNKHLLRDYIRISTGSRRVMEKFVAAFFDIDQQ